MALQNKVARIRKDFFIIIPVEYRAVGSLPAAWFIDYFCSYLMQDYYVALLSAAGFHDVAHQQAMVFQVITDKPTRPVHVGKINIEFFYKKNISPQYVKKIKTATGSMNVSTPEMTTYDLLRYLDSSGQINNVATVLSELHEQLDYRVLIALINNNDVSLSVAQRLGYLLDELGVTRLSDELARAVQAKKYSWRLLVSGSDGAVMEKNKRWRILVNEKIEVDDV